MSEFTNRLRKLANIKEIAISNPMEPIPSKTPIKGDCLLIPDYDAYNPKEKYPGNIKPGYYDPSNLIKLLISNLHDPDALEFIADMMESGIPLFDTFVRWLRENKNNPTALAKAARDWKKYIR